MNMGHITLNVIYCCVLCSNMVERMVQLPVDKEVRDIIKERKGTLSYSKYLEKIVGSTFQEKPTNPLCEDSV